MKLTLITIAFVAVCSLTKAQKSDTLKEAAPDTTIYSTPEVEPTFLGGIEKFYAYLFQNIRTVGTLSKDVDVQSTLLMEMIIEKDGSITHVKILKDTSPSASASAIKALNESPKWVPGMLYGRPVRVRYKIRLIIEFQTDGK